MRDWLTGLRKYIPPLLLVVGLGFAFWVALDARQAQNPNWLQYLDIGTSVALSITLVLVYILQNRILEQQSEIMSGGHTPVLSVENVEFADVSVSDFDRPYSLPDTGNRFCVTLEAANEGNDIATNLGVVCMLHYDVLPLGNRFKRMHSLVNRMPYIRRFLKTPHFLPRRANLESKELATETQQSEGAVLPPKRDNTVQFFGAIAFDYNRPGRGSTLPDAIDILANHEIDTAYLAFALTYENAFGNVYELPLRSYRLDPVESGLDSDEILERCEDYPYGDLRERICFDTYE